MHRRSAPRSAFAPDSSADKDHGRRAARGERVLCREQLLAEQRANASSNLETRLPSAAVSNMKSPERFSPRHPSGSSLRVDKSEHRRLR